MMYSLNELKKQLDYVNNEILFNIKEKDRLYEIKLDLELQIKEVEKVDNTNNFIKKLNQKNAKVSRS